MKAVTFFQKMHHSIKKPFLESDWVVFALHFPWSITWTVCVYFCRSKPRYRWIHWWGNRGRWSAGFYLPCIGNFSIERQRTMPNGQRYWIWRIGRLNYLSSYSEWKLERAQVDLLKIWGRLVWVKHA